MLRTSSAIILFALFLTSLTFAQIIEFDKEEINTPQEVDYYDIRYEGDTLYLAYLCKADRLLYYGFLLDSNYKGISVHECTTKPSMRHYIKILDNHDLIFSDFDNFYYVNHKTGKARLLKEINHPGNGPGYRPKTYLSKNKAYFIYETYNEFEKWILAIDNNPRQYNKHFLIEIDDSSISKPQLILDGYSDCQGFQGFIKNDTLYAIWEIAVMKDIAWAESAGRNRSILFAKYDGKRWSEPDTISPPAERKSFYYAPIGFYKCGNNFYAFWEYDEYIAPDRYNQVLYKWSHDQETWGPLSIAARNVMFQDAPVSSDELLHIIAYNINHKDSLNYYIFDGKNMEKYGELPFKYYKDMKLILDRNDIPHIFFTEEDISGNRRLYHCIPDMK